MCNPLRGLVGHFLKFHAERLFRRDSVHVSEWLVRDGHGVGGSGDGVKRVRAKVVGATGMRWNVQLKHCLGRNS